MTYIIKWLAEAIANNFLSTKHNCQRFASFDFHAEEINTIQYKII
jgi:hypothetical protein